MDHPVLRKIFWGAVVVGTALIIILALSSCVPTEIVVTPTPDSQTEVDNTADIVVTYNYNWEKMYDPTTGVVCYYRDTLSCFALER